MKKLSFLCAALLLLTACAKKDDGADTARPTLKLTQPPNDAAFKAEQTINIEALCADNAALAALEIRIAPVTPGGWTYQIGLDLKGKNDTLSAPVTVPTAVDSGQYVLKVWCVDAAGNASDTVRRRLTLTNANPTALPRLTITEPAEGATIAAGATLTIRGTAADDAGLRVLLIQVENTENHTVIGQPSALESVKDLKTYTLDTTYPIPAGTPPGAYRLVVQALNQVRGAAQEIRGITVK